MGLSKNAKYQYIAAVQGLMCSHCEANLSEAFRQLPDMVQVRASFSDAQVILKSNRQLEKDEVKAVVEKAGYQLIDLSVI